ncbi:MAG: hypothetical protein ACLT9K_05850 [Clostridium sp.]|jgi:hypothetical protein|uniref:hypothetical protein n=1 Tax=unclassified Clostridium TaxID=2614128 RepID=UPI000E4EB366|nr:MULTISPECIES: hypothetical protein [unclassified Clostridium]RHV10204.1 hypothetical protein DXB78_12575 [Clostridium sp. OM05-9BH]RHV17013.1 hypothetical protein DXB73_12345 [Clostridium sp. OM05-6BH]
MLGWIMLGLITAGAIVVVITGIITIKKIKEAMIKHKMKSALIAEIDSCDNVIKLEEMETGKKLEMRGDNVSCDIQENNIVYA